MDPRVVAKDAIKRFAIRSTKASAQLERRVVPTEYVRSAKIEQFLAERRSRAWAPEVQIDMVGEIILHDHGHGASNHVRVDTVQLQAPGTPRHRR